MDTIDGFLRSFMTLAEYVNWTVFGRTGGIMGLALVLLVFGMIVVVIGSHLLGR